MDIKGMRKAIDCRKMPNSTCSLRIAGTEDEVMAAGLQHAMSAHGEKDTPELRAMIRKGMEDETRISQPSSPGAAPRARA
jgi:predicted small metal-binding protein